MNCANCINRIVPFLILLTVFALSACGGGGGGGGGGGSASSGDAVSGGSGGNDDDSDDSGSSGDDSSGGTGGDNQGDLNAGIAGRFFFEDGEKAWILDVSSGESVGVPNSDWGDQDDKFPLGVASFWVSAFSGSESFVLTVDECVNRENSFEEDACIIVQDFGGEYTTEIILEGTVSGPAKPSADGSYFAVKRDLGDEWLAIYDLDGNFVSNVRVDTNVFEWLPDGRLVYASEDGLAFVFTEILDTSDAFVWGLPDFFNNGVIGRLSVSPDGSKVAFTHRTQGTLTSEDATFWMLAVDTGAIRQIAVVDNSGLDDAFHESAWSPDGLSIAVIEGGASGDGVGNSGVGANMYILPSDSDSVLTLSRDDSLRSSEVILLSRYLDLGQAPEGNTVTESFDAFWSFDWLAE